MTLDDEVFLEIERRSQEQRERTRKLLLESGRADLIIQLDQKYREIENGVDGAKSAWHSISQAQRRVLEIMGTGRCLRRSPGSRTRYHAYGEPHAVGNVCGLPTVRNLCARDLCHVDGGAIDPEAKIVLTERGKFVLKFGPPTDTGRLT